MKMLKFRMWLASIDKRTWLFVGAVAAFVLLAIAGLLVWMNLSGYTLAAWLAEFWPLLTVIAVAIVAIALCLVLTRMKRRN